VFVNIDDAAERAAVVIAAGIAKISGRAEADREYCRGKFRSPSI
jgi:hypothetical protein